MKLFNPVKGILLVLWLIGTQNVMAVMYDYVAIDDATSFTSDYVEKPIYFICKNTSITEDADGDGWDINPSCLKSDKQYDFFINPLALRIYTTNLEIAKALSRGKGKSTYRLLGTIIKNNEPMKFIKYSFEVTEAQDNSTPVKVKKLKTFVGKFKSGFCDEGIYYADFTNPKDGAILRFTGDNVCWLIHGDDNGKSGEIGKKYQIIYDRDCSTGKCSNEATSVISQ